MNAEAKRNANKRNPKGSSDGFGSVSGLQKKSQRQGDSDFVVPSVENGIVMAVPTAPGARGDVFWPARVIHFEESKKLLDSGLIKRPKNGGLSVHVVFLSPYWCTDPRAKGYVSVGGKHQMFDLDIIDATPRFLQQYPFPEGEENTLNLRVSSRRV